MTIKEIAKLAEVSISTVSKVVNNKAEGINQETINRVLRIVKQYNYTPYGSMQKNLQSKTFILGVLVNQTDQSAAFIEGVTDTASTLGYGVMLFQSKGSRDQELQHITSLVANRVDALIWEPLSKQSLVYREKLQESTPVALIGKFKESQSPFSLGKSVFSKRATEELITLGHRDIVLISQGAVDQEIEDGFKQALLSHHIAYKADMISTLEEFNFDSLYNHSPTAFLSEDLKTAELLMKELRSIHIKVPYNVSIVALSQSGYPTLNAGNISTYPIPIREHGSHLAKQLIGECESNKENPTPFIGNSKLLGTGTIDRPITERKNSIVVVGSLNVDRILNVHDLPKTGKAIKADGVTVLAGGKGVTQSIGVAKLDKPVTLIGKVGIDYDSSIITKTLDSHNIDTSTICHDSFARTGTAYIHIQEDGESSITLVGGANNTLAAQDIEDQEQRFHAADFCLLQTEIPMEPLYKAAELAKKHGAKTILKPAGVGSLEPDFLRSVDIIIPNSQEALQISGKKTLQEQAKFFLRQGVKIVIITRDKDGAYLCTKQGEKHFPASPKADPIDTTGGADAFIAAFTVYLSHGYSLERSIHIANIAAGYSVSQFGTFPSMIDRTTLDHYLQGRPTLTPAPTKQ